MQGKDSRSAHDALRNLPQIEDGGLDDRTVASPALGFGMERSDVPTPPDPLKEGESDGPQVEKSPAAQEVARPPLSFRPQSSQDPPQSVPLLSRDEVAAISVDDRSYYVSDVPSPYLSNRMAKEDIRKTRRRHARTTAIVAVIAILAIIGVSGWFLWHSLHKEEAVAMPEYTTSSIELGEFLETVDATTLLRPADERDVAAGISGKIAEVLVQEGTPINEEDVIFRLDNPTITDSFNKARQAYDTAVANVDAKSRALDDAVRAANEAQAAAAASPTTTKPNNSQQPTADQTTNAQTAVANAQTKVQIAQNDYNRANESLHSIESTLKLAQEQQDLLTLHAPITGTVGDLNPQATVGAAVTGSTHLCTVTDASQLSLQVEIPEDVRPRVAVGQEVRITFPSIEGLAVTTTIDSFDDEDTKEVANILIKEPDPRLQKGTTAAASVIVQSVPDSYIVPLEALQRDKNNTPYLEVLLDSSRDIKTNIPVQVVATNKTKAAVTASNIQEGNTVIIPQATQPSDTNVASNAQPSASANTTSATQPPATDATANPAAQPQGEQPQAADSNAQPQGDQPTQENNAAAA